MKLNLFLNSYQQAENKLTYNFLAILEILNDREVCEFLTNENLKEKPISNIKTVYGGGESNPDGSFDLTKSNGDIMTVYFENKTNRRGISIEQLNGHLSLCAENDLLLVITPRKSDIDIIKKMNVQKIRFFTWAEFASKLRKLNNDLANQFIEYGELSGEFEELGEIHKSEILAYCDYYKTNFDKKINNILNHFHHEVDLSKYGFEVDKRQDFRWGRKGTEFISGDYGAMDFEYYKYGQFWTIGLYYDSSDHEIAFKKMNLRWQHFSIFFLKKKSN